MNLDIYEPSPIQLAQTQLLLKLVNLCAQKNYKVIVWGGYGLDGLYGKLTRSHEDIDLLAKTEDIPKIELVLQDLGFIKDNTLTEKVTYRHPQLSPQFLLEFASPEFIKLLDEKGFEFYTTPEPNAVLLNQPFYTIPREGVIEILKIQDKRAKQKHWDQYELSKKLNKYTILTKILLSELDK